MELAKQFRLGKESVEDEPCEGRPVEVVTEENIRRIEEELLSDRRLTLNPLKPELNPICYLLTLLEAHHFLHVSRIRVKSLTLRLLMSYIYIYIYIYTTLVA